MLESSQNADLIQMFDQFLVCEVPNLSINPIQTRQG